MNFFSPSKNLKNSILKENEINRIDVIENNSKIEFKKNMNILLFHNSIQKFLRLDNSTEQINIDFSVFLINTDNIEDEINQIFADKSFFAADVYFFEKEFESNLNKNKPYILIK